MLSSLLSRQCQHVQYCPAVLDCIDTVFDQMFTISIRMSILILSSSFPVSTNTCWSLLSSCMDSSWVLSTSDTDSRGVPLHYSQYVSVMLTCVILEWWRLICWVDELCCWREERCLICWETITGCSDFTIWLEDDEEEEEGECEAGEEACWRILCSISCSCCRALTKAAFSRLVCSAFRDFFWLVDMHCSHMMAPLFSLRQRQVKSVLHWVHVNGSVETEAWEPPCLPEG